MPTNDPARDRYNPSSIGVTDFEPIKFGDLEVDELFWENAGTGNNPAFRKINENQALNTRTRLITNVSRTVNIYQKI